MAEGGKQQEEEPSYFLLLQAVGQAVGQAEATPGASPTAPPPLEETGETQREAMLEEETMQEEGGPKGGGWGAEASQAFPAAAPLKGTQDRKRVEDGDDEEYSSSSDYGSHEKPGTTLQRLGSEGNALFPDIFQTDNLLFYERFKTYQDYMLADCKVSEVKEFTAEYLEKVLEPAGWQAIWRTNIFEVLVEVVDVEYSTLKAVVRLSEPFLCETQEGTFTLERMQELLELKEHQLPLQELWVVFDESGEFDQTALAVEHVRFFYKHIWRSWDEEDDDDFDYFVRCVEPRLRLYYDIAEDRVPSALIAEYHSHLSQCEELYRTFVDLRNRLAGGDSDSEAENISVVEAMKFYERTELLKQKLKLIENPLLSLVCSSAGFLSLGTLNVLGLQFPEALISRCLGLHFWYVFGYQKPSGLRAKGPRPSGTTNTHVVSSTIMSSLLECLVRDKLSPEPFNEEIQIQFHHDLPSALNACYEGDRIIICPGHYTVEGSLCIADSVVLEGYGLPDDIVIEEQGKADAFVECTGANVKISTLKLVQHDAVEGILSIQRGKTVLENCVLQCETTGVVVRTSAEFFMKNSDLYGAKGAGVEVYPGSMCTLIGNGIHHCKEGILIKDFLDEHYDIPKITMVNNVIHNNEGYGVVLVKPAICLDGNENVPENSEGQKKATQPADADSMECGNLHKQASGELDSQGTKQPEDNSEIANELSAASLKKSQQRKKRLSNLGITEADDDLMSQEMFVSIVGNHFKRNGKGSFGTFMY